MIAAPFSTLRQYGGVVIFDNRYRRACRLRGSALVFGSTRSFRQSLLVKRSWMRRTARPTTFWRRSRLAAPVPLSVPPRGFVRASPAKYPDRPNRDLSASALLLHFGLARKTCRTVASAASMIWRAMRRHRSGPTPCGYRPWWQGQHRLSERGFAGTALTTLSASLWPILPMC